MKTELIKSDLRKIALKCLELGYYSIIDYVKFCETNKIKLF